MGKASDKIVRHKKAFLAAYAESGNITAAAIAATVARQTHYDWLANDPVYVQAFDDADKMATDLLEAEARRRAVAGVDEPVIYQGQLMGIWRLPDGTVVPPDTLGATMTPLTVKKMSDTLLIFLMKGAHPEKYRDNARIEHTGKDGGPIQTMDLTRLTDTELEQLERLATKAGGRLGAAQPHSN